MKAQLALVATAILTLMTTAACNTNSDAVTALQAENSRLRATIDSMQVLAPAAASQATAMKQKYDSAQNELATARAQIKDMTAKMNSGGQTTSSQPAAPAGSMGSVGNPAPAGIQPTPPGGMAGADKTGGAGGPAPGELAFSKVVMAKNKDGSGCAINPTASFMETDKAIYVIATVQKYKNGTVFESNWSGDAFSQKYDWKAPSDGGPLCIHFYVEPKTLGLKAGSYSVTFSATGFTPQTVQFVIEASTASQSKTQGQATQAKGQAATPTKAAGK